MLHPREGKQTYEWKPATSLFHPHVRVESLVFQRATDMATLGVEALPNADVGHCGFILGSMLWALRWLMLVGIACLPN